MAKSTRTRAGKDCTCRGDDYRYAGTHLRPEFWGAKYLNDVKHIERAPAKAVKACGATRLKMMMHPFSLPGGITVQQTGSAMPHLRRVCFALPNYVKELVG